MKTINVYSDGVVTGFAPGDPITHNSTLGGQGDWVIDSATGDITFTPDDPCVNSFGLFQIESDCCQSGFSVTYTGDCQERCETWECPDADPASYEFLCDQQPQVNASYNDNLFNGGITPGEQRLQGILDWIASPQDMELGDDCQFVVERTDSEGDRIEVVWNWVLPGPSATINVYDVNDNLTESFVFAGTCMSPLEVDLRYSIDLISSFSSTGSVNTSEAVRLIINPNATLDGNC